MKKYITILFVVLFVNFAYGQNEDVLKIGGTFSFDERFLLQNNNDWIWNENRLSLDFEKKTSDNTKFYSEIWIRNIGLPEFYSINSLYNKGIVDPVNLEIREAYMSVNGFLFKKMDLKAGRQYINWGTADKINPTSNFDAYDYEDILDFGRHRGSDAIKLDYYFSDKYSLEGIIVPLFRPSNLPVGAFSDVLLQSFEMPQGLSMSSFDDSLFLPESNIKDNFSAGAKFKANIAGVDLSLSYLYGRSSLPMPYQLDIVLVDNLGNVNVMAKLNYPRQHVVGLDFAGTLAGIGVWGEAAMYMAAEDVTMTTNFYTINPATFQPMVITEDSVLLEKNKPYLKFVIGADYNFVNGMYLNMQYIHGFLHEVGNDNLNDYYFVKLDKSFFYDKLKIAPVSGAFIISDYQDISNNYAFVYMPEIIYKPSDNVELKLSTAIIGGKGSGLFTKLTDYDMFMLKMSYNF